MFLKPAIAVATINRYFGRKQFAEQRKNLDVEREFLSITQYTKNEVFH